MSRRGAPCARALRKTIPSILRENKLTTFWEDLDYNAQHLTAIWEDVHCNTQILATVWVVLYFFFYRFPFIFLELLSFHTKIL